MLNKSISPASHIIIKGARQHNLQNIDVILPKGKLIVFTGLSGSGKSSLAFDTIYAEGQRKYVESLSSYARQFLGIMQKPDVDQIEGLSPAISIDQKTTSHNPRSTVGTITEIYDYLRLLYARIGHPKCHKCGTEIAPQTVDQITDNVFEKISQAINTTPQTRWSILSPIVRDKKGEFSGLFDNLRKKGFKRIRVDGRTYSLDDDLILIKTNRHSISVVIDRLTFDKKNISKSDRVKSLKSRIRQAVDQALDLSDGLVISSNILDTDLQFPQDPRQFTNHLYSQQLACPKCNISFETLEPKLFSFNTPHGACENCTGLGHLLKINPKKIIAPDLTLSEGAFVPMANALTSDSWFARKLNAVLIAEGVNPKTPFKDLSESVKYLLLNGSNKYFHVSGSNRQGEEASFSFQHEGIIHLLERRYHETNSEFIRSELNRFMQQVTCSDCNGARLKPESLSVTIDNRNIHQITTLPINKSLAWIVKLQQSIKDPQDKLLNIQEKKIAQSIVRELRERLNFLVSVGLSYLTLSREAATLAGGEAQRIRLASQIGTGLTGVLYVLDEPTIGLHPRDNDRLIKTLIRLKDLGNSVIIVEHDENVIRAADHIVDFGPNAGEHGGHIVAQGDLTELLKQKTLTAQYLSGSKVINNQIINQQLQKLPHSLKFQNQNGSEDNSISLTNASQHNLDHIDVEFPLGKFIVITGVSGSGKSSLIHDTLFPALRSSLGLSIDKLGKFDRISGYEHISKVYLIDQSPIGRTPRSNPATYTKCFDYIRQIYSQTKTAKEKGFKPGRFSFNVKGGRCEACQGAGQVKISMQFLSDIYVTCEVCHGTRYNIETRSAKYKDFSISQILDLTIDQANKIFQHHSALNRKLATLRAVGLGYIKLGQPAPTLSGGEAQRVKLAKELSVNSPGHTVYLMDEPTTGLHFEDVKNLLTVLRQLVNNNNTVIVVEHNMEVISNADWIIDLGPEGGNEGGKIVNTGTPTDIAHANIGHTAKYLINHLK